ncbi:MAG: tetratricopeptide repeat protein [Alphaproteobacteria bacterium]|nr:tetratricopeptide repeat protein [Alphaproteobacteria bacterium]MCB9928115.1 tetratricopeptide repeat protein [Alphaproteobacteria bacterium]
MKIGAIALALVAALSATSASAAGLERLISREQALALSGQNWGHSGAGQYLAGRQAQTGRDYGSAADFLEGALSWDPNNLDLRRRVFLLLLAEGRVEDALPHARPLERDSADPALPAIVEAAAAMKAGDYATALDRFADLDNNGLSGLIRLLGQAWAAVGAKDPSAARAVLAFSADQPPWKTLVAMHRALVEDLTGGDAVAAYAAANEAGAFKSSQGAALYANFKARQADSTVPRIVATPGDGLAEGLFSIAAALNQGDRSLSALIYGQIALYIAPKLDLTRLLVAQILADQDRNPEAAAMYADIDPASPYYYDAQLARARNLARADQADKAVEVLRGLAAAEPTNAAAPSLLGDVLRAEARFDEAVVAYDEAAARVGTITADNWRLFYHRGIALERSGQWARAESDLLAAISLQKDQASVLNYLGYSWIDRGENLQRAEDMIRRAVELRPEDGFIVDSLGWAYFRTGRFQEAARELERAATLEPVDPTINEHLGDAYWRVGRKAEARYQWQRALNLAPEDKQVPVLEQKLRCGLGDCAVPDKTD